MERGLENSKSKTSNVPSLFEYALEKCSRNLDSMLLLLLFFISLLLLFSNYNLVVLQKSMTWAMFLFNLWREYWL